MSAYPLYDVPYLVRDPNDSYMSLARHQREVESQAIVDEYFIERDKGTSAGWASQKARNPNHPREPLPQMVLPRSRKTKEIRFFDKIST